MPDLQAEATALLQRLLRLNTVNPPGNERPAQELLRGVLEPAGFEVELLGRTDARPNLVARLRGRGDGPTLCLLSHVDTVLATAAEWRRDPWSGEVAEGALWGRGAIDMKSQTAAEVTAAAALARTGWRPSHGDLLVVATVDEETGGAEGAGWLCATHPDAVRCDFLLNEGAGAVIPYGGERLFGVCVAEKGVFRFRVRTAGVAGHASLPRIGDNALVKLAPLLEAMRDPRPSFEVTDGPRAMLAGLGLGGDPADALARLRAADPLLALVVEPMLGVTLAPTMVRASDKINVIPSAAEIAVDCRVPPGLGREAAERRVHEVLGGDGYTLEFTEQTVGNGSPMASELMDALGDWLAEREPGARLLPTILPGFTDSRTFRDAFPEVVAYGFFPHRHTTLGEIMPLVHGADERIDVRDLGEATDCFRFVIERLLGP